MAHSPERTGPSAAADADSDADVVAPPAAARPEPEPYKAPETMATVVGREEDLGDTVAAAGVTGGHEKEVAAAGAGVTGEHEKAVGDGVTGGQEKEGALAHQNSQQADAEVVMAEVAAKLQLQIAEPVIVRFAPVKDVKTMLQTGLFEGKRIAYRNKKDKIDLLHGIIKGTSYFCLCGGYCDKTGKELSAKSFELHAKGESHNPNDHIYPHLARMSLFEMSKKFKDAKSLSALQEIFNDLMQPKDQDHSLKKATTTDMSEYSLILKKLQVLEEKMEQFEKKVDQIDQIQSQVNTIEQNVEFLVNQTVRSGKLFEEVSKLFGKFGDI